MDGIAEAMTEEEDKNQPEDQATNEYKSPHIKHLQLKRGEKALNDYLGGAEMMYKAYWPLMPLRRGFTHLESALRTVSGDNSFCSTIIESATIKLSSSSMLPTCNIIMRHAVNKSVHAGIKVKPESFAAFKIEMASPSFKEELEKARDKTRRVLERQES